MKIKSIMVRNFRSCPDGNYPLEQVNFLLSNNGKGKTSFQLAIRYLLNGSLPDDAIREGEESLSVSAVIDDGEDTEIGRETFVPDAYQINGEDVSEKEFLKKAGEYKAACDGTGFEIQAGPLSNRWFCDKPAVTLWDFLINGKTGGSRISGLKELETVLADGTTLYVRKSSPSKCMVNGKKVTAKVLNKFLEDRMACNMKALDITTSSEVMAAMDMPDFAKYLISIIPATMDFTKMASMAGLTDEEADIIRDYFPEAPNPISIEDVQSAYKAVFDIRRQLARQMKEWEQKMKFDGQLPVPDAAKAQRQYADTVQKVGAAAELQRAWEVYRKRVEERERSLKTLNTWIAEYNGSGKVLPVSAETVDALKQAEQALRKNIEQHQVNISRMLAGCEPLKKMLADLESTVCPLCSTLVCQTDKTSCKADLERNINQVTESVRKMREEIPVLQTQLDQNLAEQEKLQKEQEAYNQKADLYKRIVNLKGSIPELPKEPASIPPVDELQKQAAIYKEQIRQATVYAECQKAGAEYQKVKNQYDLYCSLVAKTEPRKGVITNTILNYLVAPFSDHVNGFQKSIFADAEIAFGIGEGGLEVKCRPHGRNYFLPISALSDGEKTLAVLALMDMVSDISGTRILVFDRLEALDGDAMASLLQVVSSDSVKEGYDHIILASVAHADIVDAANAADGINIIHF